MSALDAISTRLFGWTRTAALQEGKCISCRRHVNPVDLEGADRDEYLLSAVCPKCFDALDGPCSCGHGYSDHEGEDGLCDEGCDLRGCDGP
jgi:hypothetical protein